MEASTESLARIYALEPVDGLCAGCREHSTLHVLVLPAAVAAARSAVQVPISAFRPDARDDDDLANATWEDAAWQ